MDPYENEERLCHCGNCRYCDAYLSSEDDSKFDDPCRTCGGAGCVRCEE